METIEDLKEKSVKEQIIEQLNSFFITDETYKTIITNKIINNIKEIFERKYIDAQIDFSAKIKLDENVKTFFQDEIKKEIAQSFKTFLVDLTNLKTVATCIKDSREQFLKKIQTIFPTLMNYYLKDQSKLKSQLIKNVDYNSGDGITADDIAYTNYLKDACAIINYPVNDYIKDINNYQQWQSVVIFNRNYIMSQLEWPHLLYKFIPTKVNLLILKNGNASDKELLLNQSYTQIYRIVSIKINNKSIKETDYYYDGISIQFKDKFDINTLENENESEINYYYLSQNPSLDPPILKQIVTLYLGSYMALTLRENHSMSNYLKEQYLKLIKQEENKIANII